MTERLLLKSQLREAWRETINGPYSKTLVNSERGLQVHFCATLLEIFRRESLDRRIFVEPTICLPSGETRYPDLLICNSQRVIGVVELKYAPRAIPEYEKDFDTLAKIGSLGSALTISNERFRGVPEPKRFSIAEDAILCWAAVHCDKMFKPDRAEIIALGNRFLELRAITGETDVQIVGDSR